MKTINSDFTKDYLATQVSILVSFLLLLASPGYSQISIGANDLLGVIGSTQIVETDSSANIAVDVGASGANQTWDFRSVILTNPSEISFNFLSPQQTPFANEFPQANQAEKITSSLLPGFEKYNYYQINSTSYISLGTVIDIMPPIDTAIFEPDSALVAALPVSYNDSWTVIETDTIGFFPTAASISLDTTFVSVDGWGTVRIPLGDYDCIRVRLESKSITHTIINGNIFNTSTETFIGYDWIAQGYLIVASVLSLQGETDPSFSIAASFTRLKNSITGVEDHLPDDQSKFYLNQNYPNPFHTLTEIQFNIPKTDKVLLQVHDLWGKEIRTLADSKYNPGLHHIRWDGKNDMGISVSKGIYILMFQTNYFAQAKKMVLIE